MRNVKTILTNRQYDVVYHLLMGKSNRQIAQSLNISIRTVEFHLTNIYNKLNVSSRIELVIKLRESTAYSEKQILGYSTVERKPKSDNNHHNKYTFQQFISHVRQISFFEKIYFMKKRWLIYILAGLLFGIGYWHYLELTTKWFGQIHINPENNIAFFTFMFFLALLVYFGIWSIPAAVPALYEYHQSSQLKLTMLAGVIVFVSAVTGYYLNYLAMLTLIGLPHMEFLMIARAHTANFWTSWSEWFPKLILRNMIKWILVGIPFGAISGLIMIQVYNFLFLHKNQSERMLHSTH